MGVEDNKYNGDSMSSPNLGDILASALTSIVNAVAGLIGSIGSGLGGAVAGLGSMIGHALVEIGKKIIDDCSCFEAGASLLYAW